MLTDTLYKQLLFSIVRIDADHGKSIGTGVMICNVVDEIRYQMFLVTNKHVIAPTDNDGKIVGKYKIGYFSFTRKSNNQPVLGETFNLNIVDLTDTFFMHPDEDVDLAVCNASQIFSHAKDNMKTELFTRPLFLNMIPEKLDIFDILDEVSFIGYPNGIYDKKNNLPLARSGVLASPFEVDFNGKEQFIIDAQVFPGSSGSPVFIQEKRLNRDSLTLGGPDKIFFLGIISKVFQRDEIGDLVEIIGPTNNQIKTFSKQMIGLGICEKSNKVKEIVKMLIKKQGKPK